LSYIRSRETDVIRPKEVCGNVNIGLHSKRAGGASVGVRSSVNERCWSSESAKDDYVEDSIEKRRGCKMFKEQWRVSALISLSWHLRNREK